MKVTFGRMFKKKEAGDGALTPFQAVCTALAATVGTGNVAGVSRSHRNRRTGCNLLDVDICTARYVYEVCRGYTCGAFSREK